MDHLDSELARGFIKGSLPPNEWFRWEAHLPVCRACRELVERERTWSGLLKLDPEPRSSAGGIERTLARVHPLTRPSSLLGNWAQFIPAAVLAVLLGVALGLTYRLAVKPGTGPALTDVPVRSQLDEQVVARLDALKTLAADPWLADEYDTVRWLATLVRQEGGG